MKKIFLFLFTAILFSSVSAQMKIGYKAGVNFSNIKREIGDGYSVLPGFNTGVFTNIYFSDKYFLDVELLYSAKGYKSKLIPAGTTRNRLDYLSLPVLVGLNVGKKIDFVLGPEINYLTKAVIINKNNRITNTNFYQKFDIGIDAGVGYNLSKKIKLEARYNYGLSKLVKVYSEGGEVFYSKYLFNRVIQIDMAYIF